MRISASSLFCPPCLTLPTVAASLDVSVLFEPTVRRISLTALPTPSLCGFHAGIVVPFTTIIQCWESHRLRLRGFAPRCPKDLVYSQARPLGRPQTVIVSHSPASNVFCPLIPRSFTRLSLSFVFLSPSLSWFYVCVAAHACWRCGSVD